MNNQYRTRTDPPTEPGLYWARDIASFDIVPVEFCNAQECYMIGSDQDYPANDFDWFGPVDPVREG